MHKLNLLGKLAITTIVLLAAAGLYFAAASFPGSSANDLVTTFATAISNKDYQQAFDLLSEKIQKAGSKSAFATNLAEKYSNTSLELVKIVLERRTGYAILLSDKAEYVTIPLIKEGDKWRVNYFSGEAKCVDKCKVGTYCKDDKTLTECKDVDNDSCTEEVPKTCEFSCSDGQCTTVRESYILDVGAAITTFPTKIMLLDTDPEDDTATLEVGYDIYVFSTSQNKNIKSLSVTVTEIDKDRASLKVKEIK